MQPSNQIQQESTSGPPPPPAPQSSTTNLNTTANQTPSTHPSAHPSSSAPSSKPFYKNKHSGAPPSGQGYKKNFHHSNTYGSSGSAAASSAGSYHGQTSYYMKSSHPRDRNQTATSGQTSNYDSYGGNYSKSYAASNNASGGNTSSTGTYDPYTKSKELGSTGSLTGSNSSNANSLSKSNSGATTGAPQSKGQHHHHHHHQSNQWSHLNQWKNPHRRNNYGGNNYVGYDAGRNQSKYDSIGNSSGHSSGTSSTPATNVSPTSKSSTPEEYDHHHTEQSSCETNSPLTDSNAVSHAGGPEHSQPGNEPDSTVACVPSTDLSVKSVDASAIGTAVTHAGQTESLTTDLEKLSVADVAPDVTTADPGETAPGNASTLDVNVSSTLAVTCNATSSSMQSTLHSKLSPSNISTSTIASSMGRQSKHGGYSSGGYHQSNQSSNYYGKPQNTSQSYYHGYGYGRGKKGGGQHNQQQQQQTGYYGGGLSAASMKGATSTYFGNGMSSRALHGKQTLPFSNAAVSVQYSANMHHLAAANQPLLAATLAGQTGHHHPNSQAAYLENNMAAAAAAAGFLPPYGLPAHLLPFCSVMPGNQASMAHQANHPSSQSIHLHPMSQQASLNMPSVVAASMQQHNSHMLSQQLSAQQQANMVAAGSVPISTPVSGSNNSGNAHLQHVSSSHQPQPPHHHHQHNPSAQLVSQVAQPSSVGASAHGSEAMVAGNCAEQFCCNPAAGGYYGNPVLNYPPPGVPFNYPFAPPPLVSLPYAFGGGAKMPPNFIPNHAMGTPVNYHVADMNYMSFLGPANAYPGMMATGESQPMSQHHQMQQIPNMVQSPPSPSITANSLANTAGNSSLEYGDLSRPSSTYDAQQLMESNTQAYSAAMAAGDLTKSYPLLGYMPSIQTGSFHDGTMASWSVESGAPSGDHRAVDQLPPLASQNYPADARFEFSYSVCDNNGTAASEAIDK